MNKTRTFLRSIGLVGLIVGLSIFISCGEDEVAADCVGCDSDAPYSTASSSSCFETLSECNSALGSGCTRCD